MTISDYSNREIARDLDKLIASLDRVVDGPLNLGLTADLTSNLRDCLRQISECATSAVNPRLRLVSTGMRPLGVEKSCAVDNDEHYSWGVN